MIREEIWGSSAPTGVGVLKNLSEDVSTERSERKLAGIFWQQRRGGRGKIARLRKLNKPSNGRDSEGKE